MMYLRKEACPHDLIRGLCMKESKLQDAPQDLLWLLAEGTAAATGDEFFRSLARHAAEAMHAKYAFVAELVSEPSRARWCSGKAETTELDLATVLPALPASVSLPVSTAQPAAVCNRCIRRTPCWLR